MANNNTITLNVRNINLKNMSALLDEAEARIMADRIAETGGNINSLMLNTVIGKYNAETRTEIKIGVLNMGRLNGLKAPFANFLGTSAEFENGTVMAYYEDAEKKMAVHISIAEKLIRRHGDKAQAVLRDLANAIEAVINAMRAVHFGKQQDLVPEQEVSVHGVSHDLTEETREGVKKTFTVRSTKGNTEVVIGVNESHGFPIYWAAVDGEVVISASERKTVKGLHNLRSNTQVIVAAAMDADSRFTPAIKKMCQ